MPGNIMLYVYTNHILYSEEQVQKEVVEEVLVIKALQDQKEVLLVRKDIKDIKVELEV
jgi:hypothetical protein